MIAANEDLINAMADAAREIQEHDLSLYKAWCEENDIPVDEISLKMWIKGSTIVSHTQGRRWILTWSYPSGN